MNENGGPSWRPTFAGTASPPKSGCIVLELQPGCPEDQQFTLPYKVYESRPKLIMSVLHNPMKG